MVKMFKILLLFKVLIAVTVCVTADTEKVKPFIKTFNNLHKDTGPQTPSKSAVKTLWIEQKLDHFNKNSTRRWQMRYMANDELYKHGGPLFIFVGGEWNISSGYLTSGHFYDMAKEHNAYLFYTEHRFYGQSRPVNAMTNENLKYLTAEQALADLAHFVRTMKATIDGLENSKVILAGRSYSASLVTWFNKLYPDLSTGCWASSAPLFAKADYSEYKEIMGESIKLLTGDICHDRIKRGFAELESMLENKRGAEVKAMLHLCNTFHEDNDLDVFTLFYQISEIFADLVQNHHNDTIQRGCSRIMEGSTDVIGLANFIVDHFDNTKSCSDLSYRSFLSLLTDSSFSDKNIMRAWTYQTCNEFGWFQTSTSRVQPFGTKYPLVFFTTVCGDAYGDKFSNEYIQNRVKQTNKKFGGRKPDVKNVYYSHGQLDPWRAAGIQTSDMANVIPYHAHCKDFDSISDKDTPELKASKEKIAVLVRKWLA